MNKTVLTHFYNEEYLLPWWLDHHKKYFDHGILIDYASTDRSVEIIKEICPTWTVVKSKNEFFEAKLCDEEIIDYESTVPGWKIALNITEFLVGDYSILTDKPNQYYIMPCCVMIDDTPDMPPNSTLPLIKQKLNGMHYLEGSKSIRRSRIIHNKPLYVYPLGRHFDKDHTTEDLVILWYGWSPFNETIIKRKLQIQSKIPQSDVARGYGTQHIVTEQQLQEQYTKLYLRSRDLSKEQFLKEEFL